MILLFYIMSILPKNLRVLYSNHKNKFFHSFSHFALLLMFEFLLHPFQICKQILYLFATF